MSDNAFREFFKYGSLDKVVVCNPRAVDGIRRMVVNCYLPVDVEVIGDDTVPLGTTFVMDRARYDG